MINANLIIADAPPWYLYLILLLFLGGILWLGYHSAAGVYALLRSHKFRKIAKWEGFSTDALSTVITFRVLCLVTFFVLFICGTWAVIQENFGSFRSVKISGNTMRVSYSWQRLDEELPLTDIQGIYLLQASSRKSPMRRLVIVTTDGRRIRSVATADQGVIGACQEFVDTSPTRR